MRQILAAYYSSEESEAPQIGIEQSARTRVVAGGTARSAEEAGGTAQEGRKFPGEESEAGWATSAEGSRQGMQQVAFDMKAAMML